MRKKVGKALSLALAMSMAFTMTPVQAAQKAPTDLEVSDESVQAEVPAPSSDELSYDGYDLENPVFEDDFEGEALDRDKWNVELHEAGWVNSELQEYVDSEDNIYLKDGKLYLNPVEKVETKVTGESMLKNADFTSGMDGWSETIANWGGNDGTADATRSIADGKIKYSIKNAGTADWNVQLKQEGISFEAGKKYVVQFKITSTEKRQFKTGVMSASYEWFGGTEPVIEANEETVINFDFVMPKDSDADFYISLGKVGETPASDVTISDLVMLEKENLLSNPYFADDMAGWTNKIANWGGADGSAVASSSVEDGKLTYAIENPGTADWNVQLKQENMQFEVGKTYKVTFDIDSDVARSIKTGVMTASYNWFGGTEPALVTDKTNNVSFEFEAKEEKADFYISLGLFGEGSVAKDEAGTFTISNVRLEEVCPVEAKPVVKEVKSYTSGRISTQNKETFTYGLFECVAKVPEGQGYLPAFWLMSNDESIYGQWPRCGEIDCMEVMGQDPTKLYGTIHYGNPHSESQGTYVTKEGEDNFAEGYHKFSCEWLPGRINWYVDGKLFHTENDWYSTTEGQGTLSYPAPFDQPFYIILNLAVGGRWVGNPDENTQFDNPFIIDSVKVYQKSEYSEDVDAPEKKFEERRPDEEGNFINNGKFDTAEDLTDDTDWKFLTALGGEATATIADGVMTIDTDNEGTVDYSVQLVQANVPLQKGATYEVQFDAKASADREMGVDVKGPDHGYMAYMPHQTAALTTEMQTYKYTFVMKAASDANGRLEYNMGATGSDADIIIDNVSIKKIADPDPNAKDEKVVLANGNYIYNGKFQEGKNHLGEWTVAPENAASVTDFADGRRLNVKASAAVPVVISQDDLTFPAGVPYEFSFNAKADAPTSVEVVVGGYKQVISVAASTTPKTYKFKIPETTTFANKNVSMKFTGNVSIDDVSLAENALIKNGNFNNGLTGYETWNDDSAKVTYGIDALSNDGDDALQVTITDTADQDWKIQIKQNNVPLENGKTYRLSYDVKSDLEREIRVIMQGGKSLGYPVYSEPDDHEAANFNDGIQKISGDNKYVTITEEFTMEKDSDEAAFLSICLGAVNGNQITDKHTVTFDNISLVEIDELTSVKPEDPPVDPPKPEDPPVDPPKPEDPPVDPPKPVEVKPVTVTYATHVQTYGDKQGAVKDGAIAGTTGLGKRLENIKIAVSGNDNLGIQYTTHCQSYGWMNWSANNEVNGTSGEAKRLEAIEIKLTGADKDKYDVYYRVHAQSYGWLAWAKNGAPAGTAGLAKRLEAIQVVVVKKGEIVPNTFKGVTSKETKAYIAGGNASATPSIAGAETAHVQYRTHVQKYGWQSWKADGKMAGTSGEAKRLEAINIELKNKDYAGGICYNTHVQSFGWQADVNDSTKWVKDGKLSGTSGKAKRLEAIQIKLYGEMAEHYDVYYRVHAQTYGWMNWAKNGETAGTAGFGKRLEGIQIVIVPKGAAAPAATYQGATTKNAKAFIKK